MNIRYAVYWNTAATEGGIEEVDMDEIWTSENQNGWTYQHVGGPHDNYQGDYESRKEAEEVLATLYEGQKASRR